MMAADGSVVAEHRIQIPAVASESGQADRKAVAAAPEKWLNYFVRLLAVIESVGNAFGTLAFTWGTVVLLGGYPSNLIKNDFDFATAIIFLEATRYVYMLRNFIVYFKLPKFYTNFFYLVLLTI
jgi:hypothetical protein